MKRFFILFMMTSALNLFANDQEVLWVNALEAFENHNLQYAESIFDRAIEEINNKEESVSSNFYVDYAQLLLTLGKYQEALAEINKAISLDNFKLTDKIRAVATRIVIKSLICDPDGIDRDIAFLSENSPVTFDNLCEKLIVRNIPNTLQHRQAIKTYFVMTGICKDQSDINFLPSGICIISKTGNPLCKRFDDPRIEDRTICGCKEWCDLSAVGGMTWCSKAFGNNGYCLLACNTAVYALQKGCHWCCEEGAFYERCAAPFADILSAMSPYIKAPCDPMWD